MFLKVRLLMVRLLLTMIKLERFESSRQKLWWRLSQFRRFDFESNPLLGRAHHHDAKIQSFARGWPGSKRDPILRWGRESVTACGSSIPGLGGGQSPSLRPRSAAKFNLTTSQHQPNGPAARDPARVLFPSCVPEGVCPVVRLGRQLTLMDRATAWPFCSYQRQRQLRHFTLAATKKIPPGAGQAD